MSSEFKYRLKFSIWSFAFSAELNPSLKVELSSSRERVLPPWSKCCDLVSSLLKGKFLHKLWRFWQKYVSDVAKARMQLHYSALVSSPAVCSCTIQDRSLGSPVCSLGLLAGHVNGDKAATAVPCVQTRVKITAELVSSQMKTGPGEWLAEFTATTELRGMQRLKKNFSPLLCPRSSCMSFILLRFPSACAVSLKFWERSCTKEGGNRRNQLNWFWHLCDSDKSFKTN